MDNLYLYQKLKTVTNEFVTIVKIQVDEITVLYKGKMYIRKKDIVGRKLFIFEKDNQAKEPSKLRTCKDCMLMRSGECVGAKEVCEFFKYAPTISKEEMDSWPKFGDALSIKFGLWEKE